MDINLPRPIEGGLDSIVFCFWECSINNIGIKKNRVKFGRLEFHAEGRIMHFDKLLNFIG